jgi:intermediate cleaving peptidase 55
MGTESQVSFAVSIPVLILTLIRRVSLSISRCRLVAGNVITVEPGCYVPFDSSFPKHFHGQGIRIEVSDGAKTCDDETGLTTRLSQQDEVAFTRDGPLVLSVNAPKEIVDVEGACQGLLE